GGAERSANEGAGTTRGGLAAAGATASGTPQLRASSDAPGVRQAGEETRAAAVPSAPTLTEQPSAHTLARQLPAALQRAQAEAVLPPAAAEVRQSVEALTHATQFQQLQNALALHPSNPTDYLAATLPPIA